MQVKELTGLIEEYAPLSLQESYDNAGLICGEGNREVKGVLLCTDITEEVVDEAIEGGYNLIISHHPLTLQGLKNIRPDNSINRCLVKAIKHDLNLYAAHTNMDAVRQGVSAKMADKLGLLRQHILRPQGKLFSLIFYTPETEAGKVREAVYRCGGGHIGNYRCCSFNSSGTGTFLPETGTHPFCGEAGKLHTEKEIKTEITVPEHLLSRSIEVIRSVHPYEEPVINAVCLENTCPVTGFGIVGELPEEEDTMNFLRQIKETFHCATIRYTAMCTPKIKKVALCGGAGASLTPEAIRAAADIYISGDFKYHDFFLAENRIILADIGHYESEQYTKEIFYELVTKKISKFAVQFSKVNTNPINYL